jgi:membrane protein required for colicin V production
MSLNWLDYVIFTIIGLSILTGIFRGFVKELIALIVWILAIWLAYRYSQSLDPMLQSYIQDKNIRMAMSFMAILLATLIVGGLFNALLSFILTNTGLSGMDRLMGMGFGLVRGVFIVALVMLVFKVTAFPSNQYIDKSILYAKFDPLVNLMTGYVPDFVAKVNKYEHGEDSEKNILTGDKVALNNILPLSSGDVNLDDMQINS